MRQNHVFASCWETYHQDRLQWFLTTGASPSITHNYSRYRRSCYLNNPLPFRRNVWDSVWALVSSFHWLGYSYRFSLIIIDWQSNITLRFRFCNLAQSITGHLAESKGLTRSKIPRLGRRHTMYKQQCGGGWVNKISQCLASHGPLNTSIMIVVILSTKLSLEPHCAGSHLIFQYSKLTRT